MFSLLSNKFYERLANKPQNECNFVLSTKNTMAAFIGGNEKYTGIFAILDTDFNIILTINTKAYINSCGISDEGNYAIFNTAHSDTSDSEKCYFIDIVNNKILWKRALKENWKSIQSYHIDEKNQIIYIVHKDYIVEYDFCGELAFPYKFESMKLKLSDYSPYALNDEAVELIKIMLETGIEQQKLNKVIKLLNASENNSKMSRYQLSLTYKLLGDLYAKNKNSAKALTFYNLGLQHNSRLPVKRLISQLADKLKIEEGGNCIDEKSY